MAAKAGLVVKLAVVVLLLAAVSANARSLDLFDLLASNNPDDFQLGKLKKTGLACCDSCVCTRDHVPQCRCWDEFSNLKRCDECEKCLCTRSLTPKCRCMDITSSCPPVCKSAPAIARSTQAAEATTVALEMVTSSN